MIIPYFLYWFGDKWVQQIAEMVDQKYSIPVAVWPMDGKKEKHIDYGIFPFGPAFFVFYWPSGLKLQWV